MPKYITANGKFKRRRQVKVDVARRPLPIRIVITSLYQSCSSPLLSRPSMLQIHSRCSKYTRDARRTSTTAEIGERIQEGGTGERRRSRIRSTRHFQELKQSFATQSGDSGTDGTRETRIRASKSPGNARKRGAPTARIRTAESGRHNCPTAFLPPTPEPASERTSGRVTLGAEISRKAGFSVARSPADDNNNNTPRQVFTF